MWIIILLFLLITGISEYFLQMIVHPKRFSYEEMRKQEIGNGFEEGIDAYEKEWKREPFHFERDKARIEGEYIPNPRPVGNRAVIIAHGHTVNRCSSLKYALMFYRMGFHVVIYDERHFGSSTGDFSTLGEKEADDLICLYSLVKKRFGEDCRIGLHGESMGAATCLYALKDIDPAFVIADCPFEDSELLFRQFISKKLTIIPAVLVFFIEILAKIQYGYHIKEVSPIRSVSSSDVPICFIHGKADNLILPKHSEDMIKVSRSPESRIRLFEKADHAQSVILYPKEYEKLLQEFTEEVL